MDIKLPLNTGLPLAAATFGSDGLNLKLGQLLEAKVIETQTLLNQFSVKVADKTFTLQTNRPASFQPGQALQLQVTKLIPAPEFKIVPLPLPTPSLSVSPPKPNAPAPTPPSLPLNQSMATDSLVLKLIPPAGHGELPPSPPLSVGQYLPASVVKLSADAITLQLSTPTDPKNPTTPIPQPFITLSPRQLVSTAQTLTLPQSTPSPLPSLSVGHQLTLQVVKTGESPVFALVTPPVDEEKIIVTALRQLLPMQSSPLLLLQHLQQSVPQLLTAATVSEALKVLAQKILGELPRQAQLTEASQLKQILNASGLFFESKLAALLQKTPDIDVQGDLKGKLNQLIQQLNHELAPAKLDDKNTPLAELLKETLQKAHGTLAKLTLDQFNSLPKDETAKQGWVLELPFFHDHQAQSVKIQIERDQRKADEPSQQNWAVSITLTPPNLATIHCRISCYDGMVNTRFCSDAAATVDKINAHLDYLKQQLEQKGITTGFMEAHQGQPSPTETIAPLAPHLFSEKA